MKFRQEFDVAETTPAVWAFFAQIERVATCIPGVEAVDLIDADTFMIRATQRVGPISATFESKVHITERTEGRSIQFTSTGKAVRGAVGNFRATNTVVLQPLDDRTRVTVEGEAALAGMLGSVGQKVINKQADKITAEFARNLEQALAAPSPDAPAAATPSARPAASVRSAPSLAAARAAAASGADGWTKAAALLSGFSLLVSMLVLWQVSSLP